MRSSRSEQRRANIGITKGTTTDGGGLMQALCIYNISVLYLLNTISNEFEPDSESYRATSFLYIYMYTQSHMKDAYTKKLWDIIVVGGGPAGMIAAAKGASVLLLEKNQTLGKKLRITGGGRCNVTNNKTNSREMLAKYKRSGKFLHSTFSQHSVTDTVTWFNERGVELKEENEGRLFPVTDSAETVYETLLTELKETDVTVLGGAVVTAVKKIDSHFLTTTRTEQFRAKKCILATGGTSRPETGSTGDGFTFAKTLGHTIHAHNVALVPVETQERWVKRVSGVSLSDVKLTLTVDGRKQFTQTGKVLFTHSGLSGPTILNMSKQISELLETGTVGLHIKLMSEPDEGSIREKLTELFHAESNKKVCNVLNQLVPTTLAKVVLRLANIDGDTPCHSVRVEEKKRLSSLLFALPLTITGLLGADKAVISSGGVPLTEINPKTMESKKVPGLFLIGDMLDIDRPSGGYSLQLCWTTGFVAGSHAAV